MGRGKHHPVLVSIVAVFCLGLITCVSNSTKNRQYKSDTHMTDLSLQHPEARKLAEELREKGISDNRVLAAIANIPRHFFIDEQLSAYAYLDHPLPIESGQTISQPFTVAWQTQLLQLKPGEKVLETRYSLPPHRKMFRRNFCNNCAWVGGWSPP